MKIFGLFTIAIMIYTHTAICQELDAANQTDIPTFKGQDNFTLSPQSNCTDRAAKDIEKEEPRLIICFNYPIGSGAFYSNQREFEEKYGITYELYTCDTDNERCVKQYNKQVFKYLRRKFGRTWKRNVREDVYGLK